MSLPARLEAAIRRNDAAGVRDLLRDATERERKTCAKALQPLLRGAQWPDLEPLFMVRPEELADVVRTGVRKHPSAERQREHASSSATTTNGTRPPPASRSTWRCSA